MTIEKIRAYIERTKAFFRDSEAEDILEALAELERAAKEPVAEVRESITLVEGAYGAKGMQPYAFWLREPVVGAKLYTTPPPAQPAPGMFTAEEMEAAYRDGRESFVGWVGSSTHKLIQERTK